jgi:HD-GYP domain-containing protein (c-di-GMP phosphodiesterase class II)
MPDIGSVDSQLYDEACAYVMDSIRNVEAGGVDVFRGAGIAERIVESLARDKGLVLEATRRDQDYSVSRHCVNVAVFATRIAQTLNCDLQAQREVCLGGLLHELGVSRLPSKLVHKSDLLTSSEVKQLKRRPLGSAEIINRLGKEYRWLGRMVSQVMERENGTGYPVGLGGDEIIEGAKILGIADVFDACIHERPYREALSGYQALFELTTDQQRAFPDHLVKALIKGFSLYPFNECVRLSTGEVGTVIDINDENLSRPIVTVLFDSNGEEVTDSRVVDLSREPALFIEEALSGAHCS